MDNNDLVVCIGETPWGVRERYLEVDLDMAEHQSAASA